MNHHIETLIRIQDLETNPGEHIRISTEIKELREKIPAQMIKRCAELRSRGKPAVALVRNGVCGQCHMQVSIGLLASLHRFDDVHCCQNCGVYLSVVVETPAETPIRRIEVGGRVAPAIRSKTRPVASQVRA